MLEFIGILQQEESGSNQKSLRVKIPSDIQSAIFKKKGMRDPALDEEKHEQRDAQGCRYRPCDRYLCARLGC